jgi:hypothetical protein
MGGINGKEKGPGSINSKWKFSLCRIRQWLLFLLLSGTSALSERSALPGHGFDLSIEAAVSQGLVLIQGHAAVTKGGII